MKCKSILIIEDDVNIQEAIKEALEINGYPQIYTADNGLEGLELLKKIEKPCAILLDVMMPVMNGWEFLKTVKQDHEFNAVATIPIVIVSAARDAEKLAYENGAEGFVKKPVDLESLYASVGRYCATA
jgi:CheY-like chemotaxis protein